MLLVFSRWSLDMKKAAPRAGCSPFAIAISLLYRSAQRHLSTFDF